MNGQDDGLGLTIGGKPVSELDLNIDIPPNNNGNNGAGGGTGDDTAAQAAAEAQRQRDAQTQASKTLIETQQKLLADREREIAELKKAPATPIGPTQSQTLETLTAQVNKSITDKGLAATLVDLMAAQQASAAQIARTEAGAVGSGTAELVISNMRAEFEKNPAWEFVKDDFEKLMEQARKETTPEQLSRATPETLRGAMTRIFNEAAGQSALRRFTGSGRDIPPYSTGSSPGGNSASRRGGANDDIEPRDEVERIMVESARAYKMPDEQIKASLKAHREGVE